MCDRTVSLFLLSTTTTASLKQQQQQNSIQNPQLILNPWGFTEKGDKGFNQDISNFWGKYFFRPIELKSGPRTQSCQLQNFAQNHIFDCSVVNQLGTKLQHAKPLLNQWNLKKKHLFSSMKRKTLSPKLEGCTSLKLYQSVLDLEINASPS